MVCEIGKIFVEDSKSQRASKSHYWFKRYGNFAILPISGVVLGRVCASSLHSRLGLLEICNNQRFNLLGLSFHLALSVGAQATCFFTRLGSLAWSQQSF